MARLEMIGAHVHPEVKNALLRAADKRNRSVSSIINDLVVVYLEASGIEIPGTPRPFIAGTAGVVLIGVEEPHTHRVMVRRAGAESLEWDTHGTHHPTDLAGGSN